MSGPIANKWNGAGLPAGTEITVDNANTTGNGATVTASGYATAGGTIVREGVQGVRVIAPGSAIIRRFDVAISGTSVLLQCQMKVDTFTTGDAHAFAMVRSSSATVRTLTITPAGRIGFGGLANTTTSPAIAVNDRVLVDAVVTQSSAPTTSNGRVFFRVKNLTNPTWNDTGEFFYDSGYTVDAGTVAFAQARFMKQATDTLSAPGIHYETIGWETVTVNPSHTSEAQAKAYFADAPIAPSAPVTPTTGPVRPVAGAGTGSSGWSILGGAASEGEALSDTGSSRLTTGIISPDITSGLTTERVFQLAPLVPFTTGQTFEVDVTADVISTPTPTTRVRFFNGSTVVATKVVTLPAGVADGPAPTQPVTVALTASETAALNPLDIRVGIQAVR